jgi:hypothetical protein
VLDIFSGYLADGLILSLTWVAVWYPLDTLLCYGRPTHQQRRASSDCGQLDIVGRRSPDGHR